MKGWRSLKPKRHGGKGQQHAEFPGTPKLVQLSRKLVWTVWWINIDQLPQEVFPTEVLEVEHQMEPALLGHVGGGTHLRNMIRNVGGSSDIFGITNLHVSHILYQIWCNDLTKCWYHPPLVPQIIAPAPHQSISQDLWRPEIEKKQALRLQMKLDTLHSPQSTTWKVDIMVY